MKNIKIFIFIVSLFFFSNIFAQNADIQNVINKKVLTHQVYFWLKPKLSEAQIVKFEKGLKSLLTIKTVKYGAIGKPANTPKRDVIDNTYSYALTLMYEDVAGHDTYQIDAIHEKFLKDCRKFWTKVKVYDSESVK